MFRLNRLAAVLASALIAPACMAAISAEEAKQLGGDKLTAFGSEKAGNKEGTIPPYSGKAPKAPASYDTKTGFQRPDPYNDKPLFTITAQNADKYADHLDGMRELFTKYPAFKMDIYPSRRDYAYPKFVLDNTLKNATECKAIDKELKLAGCWGGFPFPIPKTGNEVMWNHLLQYGAYAYSGETEGGVTGTDGKFVLGARNTGHQQYDYYDPKATKPNATDAGFWKIRQNSTAPARQAGSILVVDDNLDMVDKGRRAYQYIPGQRRVKLAPTLAYDTPNPNNGGVLTMDDSKGFLGALDRFNFKLVGKKEKFIMYNNFDLTNAKACSAEKAYNFKNFPNPECVRWELHRVWQVEATLKEGFRHIYQKRVFFWDEDAPGAGVAENYDASGKLYRVVSNIVYPFYDSEPLLGGYTDSSVAMDLQTGIWSISGGMSHPNGGWVTAAPKDSRYYSPESMAGDGLR
ncbi:DUF1329 domain-containing protein (plasmid) [Diaphorobacter sp. HDW4B]|uniref:DUF1329 domain-containing protein n=1 Tax=Diaphorobacter sp. HDW4B TaxID=2714925 RepID=UPI00140A7EBE|nr:DUF1329 domain-containing protein [Diaphorobacter sp. HDW4B]QIL73988.1 DUF1329 domain-containing protein [Diaphorobacter sp. HDW4B]